MMPTLKSNLYIHFIPITNFQNFTSSLFSNTICINSKNARNFSNNLLNKKIFIYIKNPRNLSISLLNKIRFIKNMNASFFVNRSQSTPTVGIFYYYIQWKSWQLVRQKLGPEIERNQKSSEPKSHKI